MRMMTMLVLAGFAAPGMAQAVDCSQVRNQQPLQPTVIAPVADELAKVYNQLGAPGGVLSETYDPSQSVDQVLLRIRTETCSNVATTTAAPGVVNPDDPAAYKPRTEFDNAPWRFNMSQNGKQMTADEFSAWMKSRGVRVARGRTAPAAAQPVGTEASDPALAPDGTEAPATGAPATDAPAVDAPVTETAAPAAAELMPAGTSRSKDEQLEGSSKP